jgi:hypothetical protein
MGYFNLGLYSSIVTVCFISRDLSKKPTAIQCTPTHVLVANKFGDVVQSVNINTRFLLKEKLPEQTLLGCVSIITDMVYFNLI